jgi:hypothetical protein
MHANFSKVRDLPVCVRLRLRAALEANYSAVSAYNVGSERRRAESYYSVDTNPGRVSLAGRSRRSVSIRRSSQSGGPFPAGAVSSLLALPNGDLWISFRSGGISPLRNRHATNYTTREAVAQDGRAAYPAMAPLDQYLISDEKSEIALARRAAPGSISDGAEVMVLGHEGYRYRRDEITEQQLAVRGWNRTRSAHRFGAQRSRTAIRSRQNWTRRPIVITREPPIVPVTEPKFAPLFGQPLLIVALVQDSVPTGRVVGIVVDLPEPL